MAEPLVLVPIQLACVGTFRGHGAGPFTLDSKVFDQIVANFNARGLLVPIDAEHASEQDAAEGSIPVTGAPAFGWIHSIENRGRDGLWGMVEWLEPARTYIKEGRYKYLSPAIRFGARDPVTGKDVGARLSSAAITNSPFLDQLAPLVAAKAHVKGEMISVVRMTDDEVAALRAAPSPGARTMKQFAASTHEFMPVIKQCLGMHELSTPAECCERMKALRELHAGSRDGMSGGVQVGEYVDRLRDQLNVPMTSSVGDIFDAVDAMIEAAIAEHEATMHQGQEPDQMNAAIDEGGSAGMTARGATNEDTMAESIQLKEVTTKLTAADARVAELSLQLNAKTTKLAELEAERTTLLKQIDDRDVQALEERVQDAFETHRDSQKLTDRHIAQMKVFCRADRKAFDELYPRLTGPRRYLMRDLTGGGKDVPGDSNGAADPPAVPTTIQLNGKPFQLGVDAKDTAARLMSADANLDMADAQNQALKLHAGR